MDLLNGVIDLSYQNTVTSFTAMKDAGVLGIIHKATQGSSFVDANYDANRAGARAAGLLWGAYHFARRGDEGTMTLAEAEEFRDARQQQDDGSQALLAVDRALLVAVSRRSRRLDRCHAVAVHRRQCGTAAAPGSGRGALRRDKFNGDEAALRAFWAGSVAGAEAAPAAVKAARARTRRKSGGS